MLIQNGFAALQRGYALVVYDGPGQGEVIRGPSHMPFIPNWEDVAAAILDGLEADYEVAPKIDFNNIIGSGVSLGGFLQGRACAGIPSRFKACILNPASTSMADTYTVGLTDGVLGPLIYVAFVQPELLPGGFASLLQGSEAANQNVFTVCTSQNTLTVGSQC